MEKSSSNVTFVMQVLQQNVVWKTTLIHSMREKSLSNAKTCIASFALMSVLDKHVASVHEGKKPHKCIICNTTFAQKCNLKSHIDSVHEMKKPFKCNICDISFAKKSKLKVHVSRVHEGLKPFRCNICDACFASKADLIEQTCIINS